MKSWTDYTPEQAIELKLDLRVNTDIQGPLTSFGQVCPWPWEPQQLLGAPIGMYHCPYCGEMVMAGIKHIDYRDMPDPPPPGEEPEPFDFEPTNGNQNAP